MYLAPHFHSSDPAHARALMCEHPLARLVFTGDEGFPFVTHLRHHAQERDGTLVLLGYWLAQWMERLGLVPESAHNPEI